VSAIHQWDAGNGWREAPNCVVGVRVSSVGCTRLRIFGRGRRREGLLV